MIKAILMGIAVMLLTVLMDRSLRGEDFVKKAVDEDGKEYTKFNMAGFDDSETWTRAIVYGIAVGVLASAATFVWWLAAICLIAMMGLMLQYAWWWGFAGTGRLKALIWFILIQWIFQSVAGNCVRTLLGTSLIGGSRILTVVVQALPSTIGALCNGSAIVGTCRHYDKKGWATFFTWLTWICVILSIGGSFAALTGWIDLDAAKTQVVMGEEAPAAVATPQPTFQPAPQPAPGQMPATTPVPTPAPTAMPGQNGWWTFYNLLIQNDGLLNDNDFGPNPYKEGWWIVEYVNEMLARIRKDPVLGAADIAYFDHIAGTDISGVKYDKDPQRWLDNINARAVEFVRDQTLYNRVVDEFIRVLNSSIVQNVEIKLRNDVRNLMYMDPNNTVSLGGYGYGGYGNYGYGGFGAYGGYTIQMPKVIMKAHNEQAYFLVFTVKNGSSTGEAIYKLACGYQPPIEKGGNGINPGGNDGPGPGPGPSPGPEWKPKDPTQGTNVGGNDDPGPGTFTGTGVGSWTSAADTPYSSTSGTYSDYQADIQTDASAGGTSHAGGTPNVPTVATPAGADKDDNADSGTGYGGIDVGTTVSAPVTDTATGQTITTKPAGEWGGPPD